MRLNGKYWIKPFWIILVGSFFLSVLSRAGTAEQVSPASLQKAVVAKTAQPPTDPAVLKRVEELILDMRGKWAGEVVDELSRIGEPAVQPLIEALNDEDWGVRYNAAIALGKIGDPRAVQPLADMRHTDMSLLKIATGALSDIGEPAIEALAEMLQGGNKHVRWEASKALGNIGNRRAINPLIGALRDSDIDVREGAAAALKKIEPKTTTQRARIYYCQYARVFYSGALITILIVFLACMRPLVKITRNQ